MKLKIELKLEIQVYLKKITYFLKGSVQCFDTLYISFTTYAGREEIIVPTKRIRLVFFVVKIFIKQTAFTIIL